MRAHAHTHTQTQAHTYKSAVAFWLFFENFGIFCEFHFTFSIMWLSRLLLLVQQQAKQVVWVKVQLHMQTERDRKGESERQKEGGINDIIERFLFSDQTQVDSLLDSGSGRCWISKILTIIAAQLRCETCFGSVQHWLCVVNAHRRQQGPEKTG